jgi:hypothetical protein
MKEMIKVVISKNAPRPQTILLQFKKYSGLKIRFFLVFFSKTKCQMDQMKK